MIFAHTPEQKKTARARVALLQEILDSGAPSGFAGKKVATSVRSASAFIIAEEKHQNYLAQHPNGYCNHKIRFNWPASAKPEEPEAAGAACSLRPRSADTPAGLDDGCRGAPVPADRPLGALPLTCSDSVMAPKAHGTCARGVRKKLRWGVDASLADTICCFNRHAAERSGYWLTTRFLKEANSTEVSFYDSVTQKLLFVAPRGRSFKAWEKESRAHGWPSFRDEEVVWDEVRVLPDSGECVSLEGTHLGHNLPDKHGNRYCINLVSIAAEPPSSA